MVIPRPLFGVKAFSSVSRPTPSHVHPGTCRHSAAQQTPSCPFNWEAYNLYSWLNYVHIASRIDPIHVWYWNIENSQAPNYLNIFRLFSMVTCVPHQSWPMVMLNKICLDESCLEKTQGAQQWLSSIIPQAFSQSGYWINHCIISSICLWGYNEAFCGEDIIDTEDLSGATPAPPAHYVLLLSHVDTAMITSSETLCVWIGSPGHFVSNWMQSRLAWVQTWVVTN